jgi:surfeit locus 1 family protein
MSSFQPGRGPTVLTLAAVAAFASLGLWQVQRHHWRQSDLAEKNARIDLPPVPYAEALGDPAAHLFRRATVEGRFELADTVLVGPAQRGRELGARVLTPLRIAGAPDAAPRVLVDRGFVPSGAIPGFLPPESGEGPPVLVTGLALELAVGNAGSGTREKRRTHFPRFEPARPSLVAKLEAQLPYPLHPLLLQSVETAPGGLPIGEVARPVSPVDHRAYALTWFAAGALSLAAWVEYGRRRARELSAPGVPERPGG